MSRETLRVFLFVTCLVGICLTRSTSKQPGSTKSKRIKIPSNAAPSMPGKSIMKKAGSLVDKVKNLKNMKLPNLEELFGTMQKTETGLKYTYKGCDMTISDKDMIIELDLNNAKCKNAMSLSDLFAKITGKPSDADKFVSLDKFNVEKIQLGLAKGELSFVTSSKEPFQLIKGINLKVSGKLEMSFNFITPSFKSLGIRLSGEVTIGSTKLVYSLEKTKNAENGKFVLSTPQIKVSDFYKAFTGNKELDDTKTASTGSFTDITLDRPQIKGSRDAQGNTELVLSASSNIPGMSQASFVVIVSTQYGKNGQIGVIVKFDDISPATILTKLTKLDLKDVPIINDITLSVIIEYANSDVVPNDPDIKSILNNFSPTGTIEGGTKLKFFLPFKKLIENQGLNVPTGTNLDQYVFIIIKDKTVSFEFPKHAAMDLLNILIAFVPKYGAAGFQKVFATPPKVTFTTFEIDVKTMSIDIGIETTAKLQLGKGFLSLDSARFYLHHQLNSVWEFSFVARKTIGSGVLDISIKKVGEQYNFEGTIDQISTADITAEMKVDSRAAKVLETIKALNFGLTGVKITATFGNTLDVKIIGTAQFLKWRCTFEGYIVETAGGTNAMAFGIVVTNVGVGEIAKAMFETENKKLDIKDASWMSKMTVVIIAANKAATDEITFEDKNLVDARKLDNDGVAFYANIDIPSDCRGETLCEFVKKHIGAGQSLILNGVIQKDLVALSAEFEGSLKIGNGKYAIEQAMFMVRAGLQIPPEFGISGSMRVKFPKSDSEVVFSAKLGLDAALTVSLSLEMEGMWKQPFNIKNLEVGNLKLDAAINTLTGMPSFGLSGIIRIGDPSTAIEAKLAGGFETGLTNQFYFYAEVNELTIDSILKAFNVKAEKMPTALKESGFPEGLVVGLSLPTGRELKNLKVKLEPGFFMQGIINILGYKIECEILFKLPTSLSIKARFDKIVLAGGAIKLRSVDDENVGPQLDIIIAIGTGTTVRIDAYIEVLGIGVGARIDISNEGFNFVVSGNFLGLFDAKLELNAPYRKQMAAVGKSEWKVSSCLSASVAKSVGKGAGENVEDTTTDINEAEKDCDTINTKSGSWYEIATEKVAKYKKRLTEYEEEFQASIKRLEEKKATLKQSCVQKCEKKRVWVGGLGEKDCDLGEGKTIRCPTWIEKKYMRDDPYCLGKCNSNMLKNVLGRVKGGAKLLKYKVMEKVRKFYAKLLAKLEVFLISSKKLFDNAQAAAAKLKEIKDAGVAALKAASEYIADNLIYIEKICINSALNENVCFSIDAKFYIGGKKNGKLIELENEEGCFNVGWAKEIGQKIAKKAFPALDAIKDRFLQLKTILFSSVEEAKTIDKDAKEVEDAEGEKECSEKRTLEEMYPDDYESVDLWSDIPEYVVRNDDSMRAFRDLFFNDDENVVGTRDEGVSGAGSGEDEASGNAIEDDSPMVSMQIDPATLSNADNSNKCKRAEAVINAYSGISASINALAKNNRAVRRRYETFTQGFANRLNSLEKEILEDVRMYNMTEEETADMMFYVRYGKEGITNWKRKFDHQFALLDKSSVRNWKAFLAESVAEKKLDVASFLKLLSTASQETAKKWEVPGHQNDMQRDMNYAEQVLHKIMASDDNRLSGKHKSINIKRMIDAVQNMKSARKDIKCD